MKTQVEEAELRRLLGLTYHFFLWPQICEVFGYVTQSQ